MLRKPKPASGNDGIDLFAEVGGAAKCLQLAAVFYAHVDADPILRPLFPGKNHRCAIEQFAAFLVQILGGPPEESAKRWWLSLRESHRRFAIGQEERKAWMKIMRKVLRDVPVSPEMRLSLAEFFQEASLYLVNRGPGQKMFTGEVGAPGIRGEMRQRWKEQQSLDAALAAVRAGENVSVHAYVDAPNLRALFERNRSVFAHFVGLMIGCGDERIAAYAVDLLRANPDLAQQRYNGRGLLHAAAAAGSLPMVEELLKRGADANLLDGGGHTPLYTVGNECPGGGLVIRALVQAGASVDACDGVKRCTALHMAARRDNVEAAEALLDCGANIEARDSLGETPLRRAVNCGQQAVARLLLARGADPYSVGSKGLTPITAARTAAMRNLLSATAPGVVVELEDA